MRGVERYWYGVVVVLAFSLFISITLPAAASFSTEDNHVLSSNTWFTFSSNRTIVFSGDEFELGFFSHDPSSRAWYLGIWFKKIPKRYYVWVANRNNPLYGSTGTLRISKGNLVLLDHSDTLVWSTNITKLGDISSLVAAELLDDGNFVLRHSTRDGYLWQSFDYPTDTLLKGMKLGWEVRTRRNKFLISWRDVNDPSTGNFSYRMDTEGQIEGIPRIYIWNRESRFVRVTPWKGISYIGVPQDQLVMSLTFTLILSKVEVSFKFDASGNKGTSVLRLTPSGSLQHVMWNQSTNAWDFLWNSPTDPCDKYATCGPNAYCNISSSYCHCVRGFELDPSGKCVRKKKLSCTKDDFLTMAKIELPDTTNAVVEWDVSLTECEERCLRDCNCTAYANPKQNGKYGCLMWTGELFDMRSDITSGQEIYIRYLDKKKPKTKLVIWICVGVGFILLVTAAIVCFYWRRRKTLSRTRARAASNFSQENIIEESLELPLMDFDTICMATENFSDSNNLGEGGFGVVYKGRLDDGQEIAVKRLSKVSHQGMSEFKTELNLITKVQHINLVRLLGYCVNGDEKLLIYEYLPNRSLDIYLFDKTGSFNLNWEMRFEIIKGIARGLSYPHEESAVPIIHRDLKPSNILLGRDMTPKISDFGMARIFDRGEKESNTKMIVGTYGYMAPEYSQDGIFSEKSDVFSYGVLVLEILCSKSNKGFSNYNDGMSLLTYVWKKWKEGGWEDAIDPILDSSSEEVKRCLQVGLLCVQYRPEDRPIISMVLLMLLSKTETIPQPYPPGYYVDATAFENIASSSYEGSSTVNQDSFSILEPR